MWGDPVQSKHQIKVLGMDRHAPTRHNRPMLAAVTFIGSGVIRFISKVLLGTTISILRTKGWLTH